MGVLFLIIFQTGCKKTDLQLAENPQESVDIRSFFSESKAIPDQVVRVMEELKVRSENSRLVGDISKRYGSALWEKSMIKNPVRDRSGTSTILKNQEGRNDTLVIIPLLKNKSNQVYAYIEAHLTDKVELRIRTAKQYSKKKFGKGEKRVGDAEKHALRLMLINKEVFGYKEFQILDKRLFMGSYNYKDSAEKEIKIVLKDKENTFNKLFYNEMWCLDWILLDCTRENTREKKTDNLKRDAGFFCKEIGWDYECYGYWDDDGEDDGNPDPCDDGRIMERLPPCDERGENPGWEPIVPGGIIPPSEQQLLNALANNPFAFFKDIPCEIIKAWLNTAKHKVAQAQIDKLNTLRTKQLIGPVIPFAPLITIEMVASVQKLDDAYSTVVNMDYFAVKVDVLPYTGSGRLTPDQFLSYIRKNINDFVDTDLSEFTPYKWYGINDTDLWNSDDPIGAVIAIDIKYPDNGSVIVSGTSGNKWTFTTIKEPKYKTHPVSGNRDFGYLTNPDGSYTFYTRGVDRLTNWDGEFVQDHLGGIPFKNADKLWKSFQSKIYQFVEDNHGFSTVLPEQIHRPNYSQLKAVIEGHAPLSILSKDCP